MLVKLFKECEYAARPGFINTQEDWVSTIKRHLGDTYTLVESHTLWEMRLLIFCQTGYEKYISAVDKGTEATGVAHVLGIIFKFRSFIFQEIKEEL